ncbi:MAG TPA: CAP domain-containing protein [Amaricoccus sp.]|jgi:uncharacterized protein YkwD|nr:CAP domain-containing protein [Amaricoccus sp.]
MRKTWKFAKGSESFKYADDGFRGTSSPREASGHREDGALAVIVGGPDADGTSGGWQTPFSLRGDEHLTLSFRVRVTHGGEAERDDLTLVLVKVDGQLQGVAASDYALRVRDGAEAGWQTVTVDLGALGAGRHTLTIGGFSTGSATAADRTRIQFDDVTLSDRPPIGSFEARVLRLVNDIREDRGLDPLINDHRLNLAAEDWSRTMARKDIFEHSDVAGQLAKQGYQWSAYGENIAAGYETPEAVVAAWMDSPGHRGNILSPAFEEIGIGYCYLGDDGGDAPFHHYWTQEFGTARDSLV